MQRFGEEWKRTCRNWKHFPEDFFKCSQKSVGPHRSQKIFFKNKFLNACVMILMRGD